MSEKAFTGRKADPLELAKMNPALSAAERISAAPSVRDFYA